MVTVKYEVSCTKGNVVNKIVIEHCCIQYASMARETGTIKRTVCIFSLKGYECVVFLFCDNV